MTSIRRDPIGAVNAQFSEIYIPADDGVELRVFHWEPTRKSTTDPLVFVAGWVSVIDGWVDLIRELAESRPVFYIETREKRSARITRSGLRTADFTVVRMGEDIKNVCQALSIDLERTVFSGSSMGANAVLEAIKRGMPAKAVFAIGPNARFRIPPLGRVALMMPAMSYHVIKFPIIWYLTHIRVDQKKEPEQAARYRKTLLTAHPARIRFSARGVVDYSVFPDIERLTLPVAVAHAKSDKLHAADTLNELIEQLPNGRGVVCESNKFMHSAALVRDIDAFLADIAHGASETKAI